MMGIKTGKISTGSMKVGQNLENTKGEIKNMFITVMWGNQKKFWLFYRNIAVILYLNLNELSHENMAKASEVYFLFRLR